MCKSTQERSELNLCSMEGLERGQEGNSGEDVWVTYTHLSELRVDYCINTLLEAVRHFRSVVVDAGSRGTTAHAHQCCIFQGYPKAVPSRMKLTMREPANHDNGQGVMASDVILQQRIEYHISGLYPISTEGTLYGHNCMHTVTNTLDIVIL